MKMPVSIETPEPAHVQAYRALMREAYAQSPDVFTSTREERATEPESWWLKRIADPGGMAIAFGAFAELELIGTAALEFAARHKMRHKALLIGMYVKPNARTAGIGTALLEAALDYLQHRQGISMVVLTFTQGNENAIRVYRAAGLIDFGTEPRAIRTPQGYSARVHMWRNVQQ